MIYLYIVFLSVLVGYFFRKFEEDKNGNALEKALKREKELISDVKELKEEVRRYRHSFKDLDPAIFEEKLMIILYDADDRRITDNYDCLS